MSVAASIREFDLNFVLMARADYRLMLRCERNSHGTRRLQMIVSIKTKTPRGRVVIETLPGWGTDGKAVPVALVSNGAATPVENGTGGSVQLRVEPGDYMMTETDMIEQPAFIATPEGIKQVVRPKGTSNRINEVAGPKRTYFLQVASDGQIEMKSWVDPKPPDAESVKKMLDHYSQGAIKATSIGAN